jgi:hypothetical protein
MNVFGYIKPKNGSGGQYQLSLYSNVNGLDLIEEKNVSMTIGDTFTSEFAWNDLASGWYTLMLEDKDTPILRQEFYINTYTKPIYKITGDFDRKIVESGESISYDFFSGFYDGTPAENMAFNYYLSQLNTDGRPVYTDANGNASIVVKPEVITTSWRPQGIQLELYNTNAEDYRVTAYDSFVFFPKSKMLELTFDDENDAPVMTVAANQIDTSEYGEFSWYDYDKLKGAPIDSKADLKVTEIWYDKIEKGQIYDYINKVSRTSYDYVRRTQVVDKREILISDGIYEMTMPYVVDSESTFEVEVTLDDGKNGTIIENKTVNYQYTPRGNDFESYYSLELEDETGKFFVGEMVEYYLDNSGKVEAKADDQMMVMLLQDGLLSYEFNDSLEGSFIYEEDFYQNVYIQAVYVTDGEMKLTENPTLVRYDYSEREMTLEIETDRTDFGPGDVVELNLKTYDASGKPYPADINISIVDEAYFTLYSQATDMLESIYRMAYGTGILSDYVSSQQAGGSMYYRGMAEGGGADSAYYIRSDFKDTANFITISTDEKGEGFAKLSLPDNLTSWRITAQAVNDKTEADTETLNVNAKLPFYVTTILSDYFISGDVPSISLRIFGDASTVGQSVKFIVELENDETDEITTYKADGIVGEYTGISLGTMEKGSYTVTTYAANTEYTDAIQEHFEVVDSAVFFDNLEAYDVSKGMAFDEVYSNAQVTFYNQNESTFYNSLLDMRYSYGNRIDQKLVGMMARDFIKENFEPELNAYEESIAVYQNYDGGIRLLPYSDSETLISMRIALTASEYFDQEQLKEYFYGIIYNQQSDLHSVVQAHAGLAGLREPVLMEILSLLEEETLTPSDRILLGYGLASMGEQRQAYQVLSEILDTYIDQQIALSEDSGENYLAKAYLSRLAVLIGDNETGDTLFDEVYLNQSDYTLASLEMMGYLEERNIMDSDQINELEGSVTFSYENSKETVDLFGFETQSFTLDRDEYAKLKIDKVNGNVGMRVFAVGDVEDLKENRTEAYSLVREYMLDRTEATEFAQSDLIKVLLHPTVDKENSFSYEITDFIPAGFRFVKVEQNTYWYEEDGQKITFHYYPHYSGLQDIYYYIQAVMPGIYTADHAVITRNGDVSANFTDQIVLRVK